jgi:predicted deacylase
MGLVTDCTGSCPAEARAGRAKKEASVLGLLSIRLQGATPGPHLLITGGVHGDEFEPMIAVRRLAEWLPGRLARGRVTLIPVVNEAAFRRGQRTAEDDLDLARTCPGRTNGSVTERTAASLAAEIQSADYYIDLHTGGTRLMVLPLVGYTLHPRVEVLEDQRRMARAFGLPIIWGTDPSLEGRSLSVARDANVPAIYAEYLGGGRCDPRGTTAYVEGCRRVLSELGLLVEPLPMSSNSPLWIEDDRPGAGHLQVHHPSPKEGFFEATVDLGQRVDQGQQLGQVVDPLAEQPLPVLAEHSGIVLVLRSFSRVEEGECLAVVLELDEQRMFNRKSVVT